MTFERPRKRFGQHFLHDTGVIHRIIAAFNPQPSDTVVEIGPGRGALTLPLLQRLPRLHAVELDRDIVAHLPAYASAHGELILHQADALTFNFAALADGRRIRLIGNLPYNISTPLLFHLLDQADVVTDMVFMLQKEVAERTAATPGSRDYGRLSVMLQCRFRIEHLFDVGPGAFQPPPKVESSIVRFTPLSQSKVAAADMERFARVVQSAFGQRRKTLRNSLRGMVDDAGFVHAHIDSDRRAETLTLDEFIRLTAVAVVARPS